MPALYKESVGKMKKLFGLPVLLVALLAAGVFAPVAAAEPTIVEIAASSDDFSTLVAAVQAAGLVDVLNGPGSFTVFAPTDAAFAKLLSGLASRLKTCLPIRNC